MEEQRAPPALAATAGTAWAGIFGGPLAWFASQQVSYALVPWACHGGPPIAIELANLIALAVAVATGALAWRDWRHARGDVSDEAAPPAGRERFIGLLGMMLSSLFGLVIVAQMLGMLWFGACQR